MLIQYLAVTGVFVNILSNFLLPIHIEGRGWTRGSERLGTLNVKTYKRFICTCTHVYAWIELCSCACEIC
jgi:hypothetical protein